MVKVCASQCDYMEYPNRRLRDCIRQPLISLHKKVTQEPKPIKSIQESHSSGTVTVRFSQAPSCFPKMFSKLVATPSTFLHITISTLLLSSHVTGSPTSKPFQTLLQSEDELLEKYDYIVVGGGTSGLVVANRLTEDKDGTLPPYPVLKITIVYTKQPISNRPHHRSRTPLQPRPRTNPLPWLGSAVAYGPNRPRALPIPVLPQHLQPESQQPQF